MFHYLKLFVLLLLLLDDFTLSDEQESVRNYGENENLEMEMKEEKDAENEKEKVEINDEIDIKEEQSF